MRAKAAVNPAEAGSAAQAATGEITVLCVADHIGPRVYSPGVKDRFQGVQLVISAGDLPLSYYDFLVSSLNKPLLFVFGNYNLGHYRRTKHKLSLDQIHNSPVTQDYV